MWGILQKNETG